MFWIFLIVIVMSAFLVNLGAMSVLLKLVFVAFKAALVVIILFAGYFLWHWFKGRSARRP